MIQDYKGIYSTLQVYTGLYSTIQDYIGLYSTIQVYTGLYIVRYLILRTPCEFDLEFQGSGVATALTQLIENYEPISPW